MGWWGVSTGGFGVSIGGSGVLVECRGSEEETDFCLCFVDCLCGVGIEKRCRDCESLLSRSFRSAMNCSGSVRKSRSSSDVGIGGDNCTAGLLLGTRCRCGVVTGGLTGGDLKDGLVVCMVAAENRLSSSGDRLLEVAMTSTRWRMTRKWQVDHILRKILEGKSVMVVDEMDKLQVFKMKQCNTKEK